MTTKCTKELIEMAVKRKGTGMSNRDLAQYLGIAESTFYEWTNRPKTENQSKLSEALKKAESDYKDGLRKKILEASDKDWKASAWMLERQYNREYGRDNAQLEAQRQLEKSGMPPTDFGLIIAAPFLQAHRDVAFSETGVDLWLPGGRNSGKSSYTSLEITDGIMHNPDRSAFVAMKNGVDIRDSVWEQFVWAIEELGYTESFEFNQSRRRIVRKTTGQAIVFRGIDKAHKTKSIKAPKGTYFAYHWYEETDQFRGMQEIRTVEQSLTRGAAKDAKFYRFFTYNPPRSRDSWANKERARREALGKAVYHSTYLDMPSEWVTDQTRNDAQELAKTDEQSYRHEYLGEPVGVGGEVFDLDTRVVFREITDEEIQAFERPLAGQDFGWWPDPWALTISEWQAGSRTLITWREDGGHKLTPDKSAERIKRALTWADGYDDANNPFQEEYHHIVISSDDANPEQIAAQRDCGVNARPAKKGNMRLASYRWLASIKWVIDPNRCPHLAEEVRNKMHVQTADGEWLEEIEDGNDHWIDATRYAVMPIVRRARSAYRDKED
jgi:phage terminase large subunit